VKAAHLTARIGDTDIVLFEDTGLGRLPDFTLVKVDNAPKAGSLAEVEITGSNCDHLTGKII